MSENVIETSIDEFIELLKNKEKLSVSEAANILKVDRKQLEKWLDALEERGIVQLKYPIIGEPQIILKDYEPEKINTIKPEIMTKIERIETPPEEKVEVKDTTKHDVFASEKLRSVESKMSEVSKEVDVSILKEELLELLLIIVGLRHIEKISIYLKKILTIIQEMKSKNLWKDEDKELTTDMLNEIAENWKQIGEDDIAKLFEDVKKKIESG